MVFENSVVIHKPVKRVFEFVTNFKNNIKWQTDILNVEMTTDGPLRQGSTYRCVNKFMGMRIEAEAYITDYIPDKLCSFKITSKYLTADSNYFFEPADIGTKFTTSGLVDLKSFKFTKMLFKRNVYRQIKNDMIVLKNVLENGG